MSDLICEAFVSEAFSILKHFFSLLKFLKPKKYTGCFWGKSDASSCGTWGYSYGDLKLETDGNKHCFLGVCTCTVPVVVEFLAVKCKL